MKQQLLREIDNLIDEAKKGNEVPDSVLRVLEDISVDLAKNKESKEDKLKDERQKELISKLEELIDSQKKESNKNLKTYEIYIKKVVDAIKEIETTVNVPDVVVPEVKIPEINIPEVNVKVDAPEIPEIKIPPINIPDIKVPDINVPEPKVVIKETKLPKTAKDAMPVKLVHEGRFYKALGGSGGVLDNVQTFATAQNKKQPALVDEDGIVQVNSRIQDGLQIGVFDYVSMVLSGGDTTETYTFKTGGSSGTTIATVTVVYTTSDRDVLSSVTKV